MKVFEIYRFLRIRIKWQLKRWWKALSKLDKKIGRFFKRIDRHMEKSFKKYPEIENDYNFFKDKQL